MLGSKNAMAMIPQMVGSYRVVAQLGQGGMARALLALRQGPGGFRKLFVVKQLRLDLCDDPDFVEMFLDEARLAALLNHPNVVQTHETGEDANSRFISMEYLEGQSLGRLWNRARRTEAMPLDLSVRVISEALSGLHYAHELTDLNGDPLSVVHRDISPGNIFVTYTGQVKLLDFGIAKVSGGQAKNDDGVLKGKLAYMAPEQARTLEVDRRADLFAVGVMLWEAIAGKRLVPRKQDDVLTITNRTEGREPKIDQANPFAPEELRAICNKALALDPQDRFQSAREFRTALLGYLSNQKSVPEAEDLAALVCTLFAKEREKIAASIAKTISLDKPVTLEPLMLDAWNTSTGAQALSDPNVPALADPAMMPSEFEVDPNAESATTLMNTNTGTAAITYPDNEAVEEHQPDIEIVPGAYDRGQSQSAASYKIGNDNRGKTRVLVLGGLAIAVAGVLFFVFSKGGESEPTTVAASTAAASPSPASQPIKTTEPGTDTQLRTTIHIVVSAIPSTAKITLDGKPLSNPYVGERERIAGDHTLVMSAPGHETVTQIVNFETDGEWKLSLSKTTKEPSLVGAVTPDRSIEGEGERAKRRGRKLKQQEKLLAAARVQAKAEANRELAKKLKAAEDRANRVASNSRDNDKPKKARMGDDLGSKTGKTKAGSEIDRANPYQR